MNNFTSVSTFLLRQFSEVRELQILYLFLFLALYLTTITGNLLIIAAVAFDHHLHTPMYFFLTNLALMDLGIVSVIVPKSMTNSIMNTWSISYSECVAQVFFYFFFVASDFFLLTVMAHDRYVAICNPLQYETIMHRGACLQMAAIVWFTSLLYALLHTCGTFANTFCSNVVSQFFCEIPKLLKLSCSDFYLVEIGLIVLSCFIGLGCFSFIIITYMHIFSTVFRIPSAHGKKKAFSTCLPHLTVVSVLMFTGLFAYVRPPTDAPSDLDIPFTIIYTIIPPMLNPFIYCMRNKEIKTALWNLLDVGDASKTVFRLL
ncbi:olfactory receptor 14A16-like [Rhineura floridana]|uniref:olfactory receptor 14A16-like n=1 Tax=Rhineura floridana TaxID=261503 RepID=UPI002AC82E28|nr:olfactory receptor 14A16-like [Rhineura floridana]